MENFFVEKFIDKIVTGGEGHPERFYKIFSARGFLLDFNQSSGQVQLSSESHPEDGYFLEALQDINYKNFATVRIRMLSPVKAVITQITHSIAIHTFTTIITHQFDIDNTLPDPKSLS